mgnify:CR=1 FL=1
MSIEDIELFTNPICSSHTERTINNFKSGC